MDLVWAEYAAAGRADRAVHASERLDTGPALLGHPDSNHAGGAAHAPELAASPGQHSACRDAGRLPGAGTTPIPGWFAVGRRKLDQADADCDRDTLHAAAPARCAVVDARRRPCAAGALAAGLWYRAVPAFFQ